MKVIRSNVTLHKKESFFFNKPRKYHTHIRLFHGPISIHPNIYTYYHGIRALVRITLIFNACFKTTFIYNINKLIYIKFINEMHNYKLIRVNP